MRSGPDPEPGPGEVRVRVRAAGLNFGDIMVRLGLYPEAPRPPCVVGFEAAGVVDAAGAGVTEPLPGARVLAMVRFGAHADTVCVPAARTIAMPDGMGFEEGAALPVNYLTAYHALFRMAALRAGESVLVHMAAGGVGIAALQLCRTVPGVVTYGTASAAKHDAIRAEGCQHPIDYRSVDFGDELRRLTGGAGVDVVLDPLGEWKAGYRLLRPAGRLVAYGFSNLAAGERRSVWNAARALSRVPVFTPIGLMNDNRGVSGVNMLRLWDEVDMLSGEMAALLDLYRRGAVRPHVDAVFPFERVAEAHRRLQARQNVGKIVLVP